MGNGGSYFICVNLPFFGGVGLPFEPMAPSTNSKQHLLSLCQPDRQQKIDKIQ